MQHVCKSKLRWKGVDVGEEELTENYLKM